MSARTSISHPLRIDSVGVAGGGEIGMTLCPGRRDRLSAQGAWERSLGIDLDAVLAWQPALVVTLVEDHEFGLLGVPQFLVVTREFARAKDLLWAYLPIRDAGVPDDRFESGWLEVGRSARATLRAGGQVLLHCRAGLGRTGMIAARLLVELGMFPDDAIGAVRAARRHTIEIDAQEQHVRAAFPPELESRFAGSLYGGAVGDAMGASFEFVSGANIEHVLGTPIAVDFIDALPGSLMYRRLKGQPTDDTAMTLALLESLGEAEAPLTIDTIYRRLCAALGRDERPLSKMFWEGGPGGACLAMLGAAHAGAAPFEGLNPYLGGNGAAMRAHVSGLFPDRAFVFAFAGMQARLSRPEPSAVASSQTIALIAHDGLYTGRLKTELPPEITDPIMIAAWKSAHRDLVRGERLPQHLRDVDTAGWNTVSAAHAIAQLYADDIETAIGIAAASGKDTDTVASMVGAMLGAVHGIEALPQHWVAGLVDHGLLADWPKRMIAFARASRDNLGSYRSATFRQRSRAAATAESSTRDMRLVFGRDRQRHASGECDRFRRRNDRRILAETERPAHDLVQVAHGEEDPRPATREGLHALPRLPPPTRRRCGDARIEIDCNFNLRATRLDEPKHVVGSIFRGDLPRGIVRAHPLRNRMEAIHSECPPIARAAIVGDKIEVPRA